MQQIKTALFGMGNVNTGFLKILKRKEALLQQQFGIEFKITAVSDSSGIALHPRGFNYEDLIRLKALRNKVNQLEGFMPGISSEELPHHADADLLIESSPVNMESGNPGLTASTTALVKGWKVVFANKAPLVLAYDKLHSLAKQHHTRLAYSATVCGGLPVINFLQRDMIAARPIRLQGILNATTNHILKALAGGGSMEAAIQEAQRVGAAEANPMYDVKGQDAANKLFIIMKSFTDFKGSIHDIETEGIQNITAAQLNRALEQGHTIKLIASAVPDGNSWKLSVKPTEANTHSFLGQCEGWEMGIQLESDLYESVKMKIYEQDPLATSAAVLRDAIMLSTGR